MSKRILFVEDDEEIREVVIRYFEGKGELELVPAADGDEGLMLIETEEFDLVLLDIMLPGADGFSLCRALRRRSDVPIIFLTARVREEDMLYGYDLGADDYITKPFSLAALYAKVTAMLKRADGRVFVPTMECGRITLNPTTYQVFVDGNEIEIQPKSYEILHYLMQNKGKVCRRDTLMIRLWGYEYDGDERILDNHMKKLRKSLGDAGKQIKTVISRGYRIQE